MRRVIISICALLVAMTVIGASIVIGSSKDEAANKEQIPFPQVPRISKEEVRDLLAQPDVVLLDVRPEEEWRSGDFKLPGAVHENPLEFASWASKYSKEMTLIIY
jgi:predicted sulfurtransferase